MMPDAPQSVEELEERLSRPSPQAIAALGTITGDLLLLGVGGKMGPTLARMAVRSAQAAGVSCRVFGASRFSDPSVQARLEAWGVTTLACDLLDRNAVQALPEAAAVIFMTGMKFGASRNPAAAWAMNCYAPALVCERFPHSRVVAFSSGNVYGLVPAASTGSREHDPLEPVGEYSITVLGRERTFEYFSRRYELPAALLRLNYAAEMRYGVLVDLAQAVVAGAPIDLGMPVVNVIWQGDANAMALAALAHTAVPPRVINVAGPELLRVRDIAETFGQLLGQPVQFTGSEGSRAYLNDGRAGQALLGGVHVDTATLIRWTADWLRRGGPTLGKPTHFQVRDGKF